MILIKSIPIWLSILITILDIPPSTTSTSPDDAGEDFLKAVIDRLKQERFIDEYGSPLENIYVQTRRSVNDYNGDNLPGPLENALDQQNPESGNLGPNIQVAGLYTLANVKPFDNYNQFNENQYNSDGVQNPPQDPNLSAHNLEAYAAGLNSPQDPNLPAQNLEAYAAGLNTPQDPNLPAQNLEAYASGLNHFGSLNSDPSQQFNFVNAAINDQFQSQNNAQILNGNEVAHNNDALAVPTYYFNPGDNSIDDNLLDEAINGLKNPYDQLGQESNKKYIVEPLFVAMAGFVGIAMIFMSAVLFLPKLVTPHPQVNGLRAPQELAALTKLAVEAMDGNDCTERIACEVGRAMRSMQVGSQPIKMIEVILPVGMAKQLAQIRKAVASEQTCKLIQCKKLASSQLKINKKATAELKNNPNMNMNMNVNVKKNEKPEPKKNEKPEPKKNEKPEPKKNEKPELKKNDKPEPKKL